MEKTKNGSVNKALMVGTALISLSAVGVTNQAQAASGTGNMTAIILTPISITVPTDLHFGSITVGAGGGTVVIDNLGARTQSGDVVLVAGAASETNANVSISAATGTAIDFAMGVATYTVTNGTTNMNVNAFTLNGSALPFAATIAASPATQGLGATLNVAGGQATGTYTGTFTVTGSYQ